MRETDIRNYVYRAEESIYSACADEVASDYATGAQLHFASLMLHFFLPLLVPFVSRLGLVRLGSAVLGPRNGPLVLAFVPAKPSFFRGTSSVPSPRSGPTRLSATRVYIGPGWWGLDKTTNKLKYSPLAPSLRLAWCRHASSIAGEKRRTEETVRTNTRKANGDPYTRRQTLGAHRNEAERDSRLTGLEDLSKQNPNLSSSHVLRAERWRRTRGGEGGWSGITGFEGSNEKQQLIVFARFLSDKKKLTSPL